MSANTSISPQKQGWDMIARDSSTAKSRITIWYLKKFPLFEHLAPQTVGVLADRIRTMQFRKGAPVFTPGRELSHAYILLRGSVKVSRIEASDGKELILYLVKPGEPFGAMPFMRGREIKRVAVAHQKSIVGVINRIDWERLFSADRALCGSILQTTTSRLQELQGRMTEIAYREVNCRLARLLLRLSREYPQNRDCGIQIHLPFTQQDFSDFIAATREMTSLTINEFKRKGWIAVHNRRVCIHKPRSLRRIAE
jgi:CRP/FNR family cyclic AMP-dependent transcriptional regulator